MRRASRNKDSRSKRATPPRPRRIKSASFCTRKGVDCAFSTSASAFVKSSRVGPAFASAGSAASTSEKSSCASLSNGSCRRTCCSSCRALPNSARRSAMVASALVGSGSPGCSSSARFKGSSASVHFSSDTSARPSARCTCASRGKSRRTASSSDSACCAWSALSSACATVVRSVGPPSRCAADRSSSSSASVSRSPLHTFDWMRSNATRPKTNTLARCCREAVCLLHRTTP